MFVDRAAEAEKNADYLARPLYKMRRFGANIVETAIPSRSPDRAIHKILEKDIWRAKGERLRQEPDYRIDLSEGPNFNNHVRVLSAVLLSINKIPTLSVKEKHDRRYVRNGYIDYVRDWTISDIYDDNVFKQKHPYTNYEYFYPTDSPTQQPHISGSDSGKGKVSGNLMAAIYDKLNDIDIGLHKYDLD